MADEHLKKAVALGLAALKAGSAVAARATDEIAGDGTDPALREALEEGNRTARTWSERIDRAIAQFPDEGQAPKQQDGNAILEAHYKVSQETRQEAPDDRVRDLNIIAAGQLALHYWIASFGTLANYARQLDLEEVTNDLQTSADEARDADEKHSELAEDLLEREDAA